MGRVYEIVRRFFSRSTTIIGGIGGQALLTATRFPVGIFLSTVGTAICIIGVSRENTDFWNASLPFILAIAVMIPAAVSFRIFCEERGLKKRLYLTGSVIVLVLAAGYAFYLRKYFPERRSIESIRAAALFIASVSSILCAPFFRGKRDLAASYAVEIGLRFVLSSVFAGVLYGGIAIAFVIIQALLGISFSWKIYLSVNILIFGFFLPLHFFAGIPLRKNDSAKLYYPRPLVILITLIMLPLIGFYLAIIYIYFAKAIITLSWPEGTAAYLILTFSIVGIFLLFGVSPIERDGKGWIARYTRYFYRTLIPLLPCLYVAIGKRVYDYGITERRYFVILLALWLTGMTLYWIVSRKRAHIIIPFSICICAFLSVFGPWDAFNVSRMSQLSRVEGYLRTFHILRNDGTISKNKGTVSGDVATQISDGISYLQEVHGAKSLTFLPENIRSADVNKIMKDGLGITSAESVAVNTYYTYMVNMPKDTFCTIDGYSYVVEFSDVDPQKKVTFPNGMTVSYNGPESSLALVYHGKEERIDLSSIAQKLPGVAKSNDEWHSECSSKDMIWRGSFSSGRVMILFKNVGIIRENNSSKVSGLEFSLFVGGSEKKAGGLHTK